VTRSYTQQDQIGIAGGLNLYGFAGGDPVNFADPFGLEPVYVSCRPVGGENGEDGASGDVGHCAVRVVIEGENIDVGFELTPDGLANAVHAFKPGDERFEAYGGEWVQVGVPEGMTSDEFDRAVLGSAIKESTIGKGMPYFFSGNLNSNRFVHEIVTRAGGQVPSAAAAGFKLAPGICGGNFIRRGRGCS